MMKISFNWLIVDKNNSCLYNYMDKTNKNGAFKFLIQKKGFKIVE